MTLLCASPPPPESKYGAANPRTMKKTVVMRIHEYLSYACAYRYPIKLGTSVKIAMITIAAALGILVWLPSLTALRFKAPEIQLIVPHPMHAIEFRMIGKLFWK